MLCVSTALRETGSESPQRLRGAGVGYCSDLPEFPGARAQAIRDEDDCHLVRDEFRVLVVTRFPPADYAEFLGDDLPLPLFQPIHITA